MGRMGHTLKKQSFADGIPMLRTSERRTAKNCPQQWDYAWNMGLERRGTQAQPLWFGTGIHIALALWYCGPGLKRGPHPAETWKEYADKEIQTIKVPGLSDEDESVFVDAYALGISMMETYVELYGKDEHMLVIQPEQTFAIDVPWPKGRSEIFASFRRDILTRYVGTYDLVWRHADNGQIWLEEHKTAATIRTNHLSIDDQGGSYYATAARALIKKGLIKKGERLRGIEYNFMRKALPDPRPKHPDGYFTNKPIKKHYFAALDGKGITYPKTATIPVLSALAEKNGLVVLGDKSKVQPGPLFLREKIHRTSRERQAQLLRIQEEALLIELYRQGVLKPVKNPTMWCDRQCQFFDLCELDERGGDTTEFAKMAFRKRDVYADHRKSTDE